jgi:citrate lyase beta subunit
MEIETGDRSMPENSRPLTPAASNPLAAWTDLGLRTLDMTLASAQNFELVSRSWQQWLAAMGTLLTPARVQPARNAFGVQQADVERAVAHAEAEAEAAPRRNRATAKKQRKPSTSKARSKRQGRAA